MRRSDDARAPWVVAALAAAVAVAAGQTPPPRQFRTGVDLVVVEATVVDRAGRIVPGLGPEDFSAEIGGKARPVVSADLVEYANVRPGEQRPENDITTNVDALSGRRILLVIDQISLRPESRAVLDAAKRWVATLGASDRVGLVGLPPPGLRIEPTTDHTKVIEALSRVIPVGSLPPPFSRHNVSLWEAFRINDLDLGVRGDVVLRECGDDRLCPMEIDMHARALAMDAQVHVEPVLQSLRALFGSLGALPGPKHVVLLSAGWPIDEKDAASAVASIAGDAASANVIVHTFTAEQWALAAYRSRAPVITNGVPDKTLLLNNVEMMSSLTGGQAARIVGSGDQAFRVLAAGLSGYYRLGVRAEPEDFDGKPRRIALKVSRAGASLSAYRRLVAGAKPTAAATSPVGALNEALRSSTGFTDLTLRATSYVLHPDTAESRDMRVVLVGDVAQASAGPATAVAALFDLEGRPVTAVETAIELPATGPGSVTLALKAPPAPYILRLAVRDVEGRLGSLERAVDARWKRTGETETPGLVVFRSRGADAPTPLFRAVTTAETLVVQVPLGGTPASPPQVTFEVKGEGSAAALIRRTARIAKTTAGATVAEDSIAVSMLPPGGYVLSATIRPGSAAPFTRGFVVDPDATVPASSPAPTAAAAGTAAPASAAPPRPAMLALVRPARFSAASVLEPSFVGPILDRLAARPDAAGVRDGVTRVKAGPWPTDSAGGPLAASPVAARFVAGLGRLQEGKLEEAANAFRAALQAAPDFGPALVYLGACYAAGLKDREAASAWQMALLRERESPALLRLTIEAWLRADKPSAAAALITQGRTRWPDDPAFPRLQAQAAIADGRAREGIELAATLPQPDAPTLLAALAALYDASQRAEPVWDAGRDVETMKRLREAYAATGGESLALVDTWIAEMSKGGPRAPR